MRLLLRSDASGSDRWQVEGGPPGLALWRAALDWDCRGTPLRLRVLGVEAIPLPAPEPSEAVPSAIARCLRHLAGRGALLLLANPAQALGAQRIALAEGVRLLSIDGDEDVACWDALLALGQPCYGVRGTLAVEVLNPRPANLLSALSFGAFTCQDGLEAEVEESPRHVAWTCAEPVTAEVVGKAGFPLAQRSGTAGRYDDSGVEGVVRVVLRAGQRSCWTQPRFVAARREAAGG